MNIYNLDKKRYPNGKTPRVVKYYRKLQSMSSKSLFRLFYKILFKLEKERTMIELSDKTEIGPGLYLGHHCCITINPNTKIGKNVNLSKGVTLGQENRGARKGTPTLGDCVWLGVNSTVVGNIHIGIDVMIAPNTFVNCDIPDHSIVFGNPCIIKHRENATEGYIENLV